MQTRSVVISWSFIGAFVVVLAAGYIQRWSWTGFRRDRQLWDLLHLIVLPAVLATLPLWYRTRTNWQRAWHLAFGAIAVGLSVVIVGGYSLGWSWTGFQGNTLWDWLELLALPVVVALLPLWFETHRRLEAEWRIGFSVLGAAFAVTIVGGYGLGWSWTGFQGNTLLQWVHMLFVPFILPASIAWYSTQTRLRAEEDERTNKDAADSAAPERRAAAVPAGHGGRAAFVGRKA
jgi:hypothetical protein